MSKKNLFDFYQAPDCELCPLCGTELICVSGEGSTEDFTGDFPEYKW